MRRSAAWPLAALLAIAAESGGAGPAPMRIVPAVTFVIEPTLPVDGVGPCARDSGARGADCVFVYRAVLLGRLHRSPSASSAWRPG